MFRWDESKFDELSLNNIFGNGCLNNICPIQAINAIDTEHSFLLANSPVLKDGSLQGMSIIFGWKSFKIQNWSLQELQGEVLPT